VDYFLLGLKDEIVKLSFGPSGSDHSANGTIPSGASYERGLPRVVNKGKPMQVRPMKSSVPPIKDDKFLNSLRAANNKKRVGSVDSILRDEGVLNPGESAPNPKLSKKQIGINRSESREASGIVNSALGRRNPGRSRKNVAKKQVAQSRFGGKKGGGGLVSGLLYKAMSRRPNSSKSHESMSQQQGNYPRIDNVSKSSMSGSSGMPSGYHFKTPSFATGGVSTPPRPTAINGSMASATGSPPVQPAQKIQPPGFKVNPIRMTTGQRS